MGPFRLRTEAVAGWGDADARPAPRRATPGSFMGMVRQLFVFACVGGAFNVVYGLAYLLLREGLDAQWANAVALLLSTMAGTFGHRRVTFGVRDSAGTVGHQALGLVLLAFSLVVTAGALQLLDVTVTDPSRLGELAVLASANVGVGLVRFFAFRRVMVPERPAR